MTSPLLEMDARAFRADLFHHCFRPQAQHEFDAAAGIARDFGVGDLRVRQIHLRDIAEQGGVDLVLRADDDIDQGQRPPRHHAKCAHIVPLVGAEVDIKDDRRAGQTRLLGGEERGAAAGLQAQVGAGELEDACSR